MFHFSQIFSLLYPFERFRGFSRSCGHSRSHSRGRKNQLPPPFGYNPRAWYMRGGLALLRGVLPPRLVRSGPPAAPATISRHLLAARHLCTEAAPEGPPPALIVKREGGGLATVWLSHKPVNSLTQAVCEELKAVTHALEADPEVRGVVFGSGVSGIFSAGLDLRSMHGQSTDELAAYWTAVQEMWLALYMTPLATVAAISGHAPAGGCLLALACDYRVLVEGKYRIGLNEAQIGLVRDRRAGREVGR